MDIDLLKVELTRDEGRRSKIYRDSLGIPSIGVGRNLRDVGLSSDEIDLMLANDIDRVLVQLDAALPWWTALSDARQRALANLCFNMGLNGLLGFHKMLAALEDGKNEEAAVALMDSVYARQTGARAERMADLIRNG